MKEVNPFVETPCKRRRGPLSAVCQMRAELPAASYMSPQPRMKLSQCFPHLNLGEVSYGHRVDWAPVTISGQGNSNHMLGWK